MKKNLNKYLIMSTILGILVISLAVVYCLLIFLPNKEYQEQKIACRDNALAYHENYTKQVGADRVKQQYQFKYNKDLETCLYSGGYYGEGLGSSIKLFVIDVYSNKIILEFNKDDGGNIYTAYDYSVGSIDEFEQKEKELFLE